MGHILAVVSVMSVVMVTLIDVGPSQRPVLQTHHRSN